MPHAKTDHNVWLKLTDYGISRVSGAAFEIRTSTIIGTPGYIAPEVLLGRNDLQADKVFCMYKFACNHKYTLMPFYHIKATFNYVY